MCAILRCKLATHNEYMSKLPCQFVPNFPGYISAKCYLNSSTVGKVITKIKKVNFLLSYSVHVSRM